MYALVTGIRLEQVSVPGSLPRASRWVTPHLRSSRAMAVGLAAVAVVDGTARRGGAGGTRGNGGTPGNGGVGVASGTNG